MITYHLSRSYVKAHGPWRHTARPAARARVEMPLGSAVTKTDQQPAVVWTLFAQEIEKVALDETNWGKPRTKTNQKWLV